MAHAVISERKLARKRSEEDISVDEEADRGVNKRHTLLPFTKFGRERYR